MKDKSANKILIILIIALSVVLVTVISVVAVTIFKLNNDGVDSTNTIEESVDASSLEQTTSAEETTKQDNNIFMPIANADNDEVSKIGDHYYQCQVDYVADITWIYKKDSEQGEFQEIAEIHNCDTPFTDGESIYYLSRQNTERTNYYDYFLKKCSMKGNNIITVGRVGESVIRADLITYYNGRFYMSTGKSDSDSDIYVINKEQGRSKKIAEDFWNESYIENSSSYQNYIIGSEYHTSPGVRKYMVLNLDNGEIATIDEKCAYICTEGEWIYYVATKDFLDFPYNEQELNATTTIKVKKCKYDTSNEKTLKTLKVKRSAAISSISEHQMKYSEVINLDYETVEKTVQY